jgi:bacillopeptidase F (M6 metalloprotease family)
MRGLVPLLLIALLRPAHADPAERLVQDLAALRFDRLGDPVVAWDSIAPVSASRARPHEVLVVLVEFADRGFDRFRGEPDQGRRLADWYQRQLFDPEYARRGTLSHYFRTQSRGAYHVQGRVLPPVRLAKPRAAYGAPARPPGGEWRNDAAPEALVAEALALVARRSPGVDWQTFDRWDPADFDGDGRRDEADGYVDHLVLIYAGGGQATCQGLYKLDEKLTPGAGPDALDRLTPEERECADRLWPHRFVLQTREGQGPAVGSRTNARGGVPLAGGRWARDYDVQSEYTDVSTFIHEFGHSLGLPDLYARTSSNGTGGWDAMATTTDPVPQNLSAWSRMMLGWLRPAVVLPPTFGGPKAQTLDLADAAALVVLPPAEREIRLAAPRSGERALYGGQGNDLNRTATLTLDLRGATGRVELSFDAWWDIEAGWDFAYVETSADGGPWTRRVDPRFMPAKHGHDGPDTRPGFTGLSGDLDGDGRDESDPGCDPRRPTLHGEARVGRDRDPCAEPAWVRPSFDLSDLAGHEARIRWRYFTDMAAVMRGFLIDDVRVTGPAKGPYREDFEGGLGPEWRLDGFVSSPGHHTVLTPRYYVVEYRDPYAPGSYDQALATPYFRFWRDPDGPMRAVQARPRPGVLVWYFDGAYAWSENDPAEYGPGHGFLLPVDANPNEIRLPGLERWYRGTEAARDTRYEVDGPEAQAALAKAFAATACFVRGGPWRPREPAVRAAVDRACAGPEAGIARLRAAGRPLIYGFELLNDLLPGEAREAWHPAGELYDYDAGDAITWRLRDRALRALHTLDAPFAPDPFPDGLVFYEVDGDALRRTGSAPWPAAPRFDDHARWIDPHLPFGGADVPAEGLSIEVSGAANVHFVWGP